jgi:hypothetical protein
MRVSPAAFAMVPGYFSAAVRREPGFADPAVRKYIRDRQRLRELPKRAAEALGRRSD